MGNREAHLKVPPERAALLETGLDILRTGPGWAHMAETLKPHFSGASLPSQVLWERCGKSLRKPEDMATEALDFLGSVQFSPSVMSNSSWPHGLQHARLPCPSPTPGAGSTHVHRVGDAIQPSHPLSSASPPAFNLFQHQGLFQCVSSSHQVAKVLELQHQSFQWIFRTDFLWDWLIGSPCGPRGSQESSLMPQFKSIDSSVLSFLYGPALHRVGPTSEQHREEDRHE